MPHGLKRILLVLAIALAVPVQGFAAISAGLCTLAHHDGHVEHQHHGNGGHGPCGPCVGCCAPAAIASTTVVALSLAPAAPPAVLALLQSAGLQPAPLDRPPLAL